MADPFCGHVEGHPGCPSYRLFVGRDYSMVVPDGHRRTLRSGLQPSDLSCEGRSEIRDAPYVVPCGIITGGFTCLFIRILAAKTLQETCVDKRNPAGAF